MFLSTDSFESKSSNLSSQLRNLVKPFLLKCHPDVQPNSAAKKVNLAAIQNLNSYIDSLQTIAIGKYNPKQHSARLVDIDFVLQLEHGRKGTKDNLPKTNASRRCVQLLLPTSALSRQLTLINHPVGGVSKQALLAQLSNHGRGELTKLIRLAGLPLPSQAVRFEDAFNEEVMNIVQENEYEYRDPRTAASSQGHNTDINDDIRRAHFQYRATRDKRTAYEKNRDRFTAGIQWQNYDRVLQQAEDEFKANWATEDLYNNNPKARRNLIASILARVRIDKDDSINFTDQLIAFRRLSILLETNFDFLRLNEYGKMWETCQIILTSARDYNVSPSAMQRRRLRNNADTGFSYSVHPDNSLTIRIPMDFGDDELTQELDRNIWDFQDLENFAGMEELLPEGYSYQPPDFTPYNSLTARAKTSTNYSRR